MPPEPINAAAFSAVRARAQAARERELEYTSGLLDRLLALREERDALQREAEGLRKVAAAVEALALSTGARLDPHWVWDSRRAWLAELFQAHAELEGSRLEPAEEIRAQP